MNQLLMISSIKYLNKNQIIKLNINKLSTNITSSLVKELREKSGAGMMDCKKALSDNTVNGDINKALDWLRSKGIARANNNVNREANEGAIAIYLDKNNKNATMIEINSETDFVSRNKDFHTFIKDVIYTVHNFNFVIDNKNKSIIVDNILNHKSYNNENKLIKDLVIDAISTIRENIIIKRIVKYNCNDNSTLGTYIHGKLCEDININNNILQIGTKGAIIQINAKQNINDINAITNCCKKLAMHIVAANPIFLSVNDAPKELIDREREIFK